MECIRKIAKSPLDLFVIKDITKEIENETKKFITKCVGW